MAVIGVTALTGCKSDSEKARDKIVNSPDAVQTMLSEKGKNVDGVTIIKVQDPESGMPVNYAATINNESGNKEDRRQAIVALGQMMNIQDQGFPGVEVGDIFALPTELLSRDAIDQLAITRKEARQELQK